ncbi:MAG: hypothetical protein EBS30_03475 [Planctomycetes bacterium]|nr:hypothetical protein [Planctomycetota bacterium]
MKRLGFVLVLITAHLAGCGSNATTYRGRLMVDGKPFIPTEGQMVQIQLLPDNSAESPIMLGVDKKGLVSPVSAAGILPPGDYKVAIMAADPAAMTKGKMTDQFKNAFSKDKTKLRLNIKPGANTHDIKVTTP